MIQPVYFIKSEKLLSPPERVLSLNSSVGEATMTKAELIESLQKDVAKDLSKKVLNELVDGIFDQLTKAIKKDKRFTFPGFGTFSLKKRKPRKGRNPQTGEELKIPATKTVTFKPAPTLKKDL